MRRFHEGVDRLYIGVMRPLVPSVFRRGSLSAPLRDHLAAVELRMPPLAAAGRYSHTARTMVGDVQAGFRWRPASSAKRPVLIFTLCQRCRQMAEDLARGGYPRSGAAA